MNREQSYEQIIEDGNESEECEVIQLNDHSSNTNDNQKTRFDSRQQESSKSQNSGESEPETMDDNFFAVNSVEISKSFKKKRENQLSIKSQHRFSLKQSLKSPQFESMLE